MTIPLYAHPCPRLEEYFETACDGVAPGEYAFLHGRHCSHCGADLEYERLGFEIERLKKIIQRTGGIPPECMAPDTAPIAAVEELVETTAEVLELTLGGRKS